MDKCLLKNYKFNANDYCIPLEIDKQRVLALRMDHFIHKEEVYKLQEYVGLLFKNLDDNRRKKYAIIKNREAVKYICKRFIYKEYILDGIAYEFIDYCDDIEVITWLKDKFVSDKTFNDITNNKYINTDDMYMTYVIGIDDDTPISKIKKNDFTSDIRISSISSLLFCSKNLSLVESIGAIDRTHIYFHVKYQPKIVQQKED